MENSADRTGTGFLPSIEKEIELDFIGIKG